LDEDLIPMPMKTRARISRKQTGESIPSIMGPLFSGVLTMDQAHHHRVDRQQGAGTKCAVPRATLP
jgi:hypothetical protein